MGVEIPYDYDFLKLELALGYDLHSQIVRDGQTEAAILNGAQQFTALSVLEGVTKALDSARASHGSDTPFDRENWLPDGQAVANIREQHRPHLRYLRGVAGLRSFYEGMISGARTFEEPHHPHQQETIRKAVTYLEDNDPFAKSSQGAYGDIAGGGGKGRIAAEIVAAFKEQEDPEDPNRVLIIAPDLVTQKEIIGADGQSGLGLYATHLRPGIINKDYKEWGAEVGVATRNMVLQKLTEDPTFLERYDLIVADDGHKLLGEKTFTAMRGVRRQILALTGSDTYSPDKKLTHLLPTELIEVTTRELIEAGRLAPSQFWICKTTHVAHVEAGRSDYTPAELERLSKIPERQQLLVDAGKAFFRDNRNGVFICSSIAEAEAIAKAASGYILLPDGRRRLIRVAPVHHNTKNNHATFRALAQNQIQAVAIVGIDTGWSANNVSFEASSNVPFALVKAQQRFARGSRLCYDVEGNIVTTQYFELLDVVNEEGVAQEIRRARPLITAPQLLGETHYKAGLVIAAAGTEGKRRDFSLSQFPPHLRRAVTVGDGIPLSRLGRFGAGLARQKAPEGYFTIHEVALGLGTTAGRLQIALTASGARGLRGREFLNEDAIDKAAQHLIDHGEPII